MIGSIPSEDTALRPAQFENRNQITRRPSRTEKGEEDYNGDHQTIGNAQPQPARRPGKKRPPHQQQRNADSEDLSCDEVAFLESPFASRLNEQNGADHQHSENDSRPPTNAARASWFFRGT